MESTTHRAGFIHIVGRPNVGKSTLFNGLVQSPLSIATSKPQTTRDNIIGIAQDPTYQAVYVDTPGAMEPCYQLQSIMMQNVRQALVNSDLFLWMVDIQQPDVDDWLHAQLKKQEAPVLVLLNKTDLVVPATMEERIRVWKERLGFDTILPIHAQSKRQVKALSQQIIAKLPLHPPYYDKDAMTDRPERFFAAQLIRKSYLLHYEQEIPYSVAIVINSFQEKEDVIAIDATVYVERLSQKKIIIGKKGSALEKVGTDARHALAAFFKKSVFLTQYIKVLPDWRRRKNLLKTLGYH